MILTRKVSLIAQFILLIFVSALSIRAAGEVDTAFNAAAYLSNNSDMRASVVVAQPDGKVIIGGSFTVVNDVTRHGVARLNTDGTLDTSFAPPDFYDPSNNNALGTLILSLAVQSDGKILVGGRFKIVGSTYKTLVRLNTNGSLDTTFNNLSSEFDDSEAVTRIHVSPDNSIVIVGNFEISSPTASLRVARFDANGNPVAGFSIGFAGNIQEVAVLADGKLLISHLAIERRNADGSPDNTFPLVQTNGEVTDMLVQPDGKILIAGAFTAVNGFTQGRIARLNADGSLDINFNTNGLGANNFLTDMVLAPDGKIFIAGGFTQYNGVAKYRIAKLNADGTLDNSFTYTPTAPFPTIDDIELLSSGKLVIVGISVAGVNDLVARLNTDGSIDGTFAVRIGRFGRVRELVQQPTDGKVYIGGEFNIVNGVARNSLARLNTDGTLDTSFVPSLNSLTINQIVHAIAPLPDGKVLVGGQLGFVLRKLNNDGSTDTSFSASLDNSSSVYDIAVLPDGRIMITGFFRQIGNTGAYSRVARLNANGSLDTTFNPPAPTGDIYKVLIQPDGKVLICGDFTQIGTTVRGRIARLNIDGSVDTSFNPPGGANAGVYDFDLQADGKVVIGGVFTAVNGNSNYIRIARLNADGSLDTSFVQTANSNVHAVKVQADGKILIGGLFSQVGGVARNALARLNANGSLDQTFSPYVNQIVFDVNLQTDNKILVGGEFTEINNISKVRVARLLNAAAPLKTLFDYDGDGRADVSVFRPSTNRWYIFRSSDAVVSETTFGIANDTPAPADYDGDGKTDLAIYRASSGDWWYLSSINNQQISIHWGQAGDIPRPSDFDADGKADYIVFRPSNNTWYRFGSTGAVSITPFGLSGDKPVTGDFDGDGKSDLAIFRPSSGNWWYLSSIDNSQKAVQWGISTDIPSPADFDGDGKTDFAVYRPSTGVWYIINSSNGSFTIMNFGIAEDKPVPADFDGDGKADIAVFRPSTGVWYQQKTTQGFTAQQFGISTDVPTENAFVP